MLKVVTYMECSKVKIQDKHNAKSHDSCRRHIVNTVVFLGVWDLEKIGILIEGHPVVEDILSMVPENRSQASGPDVDVVSGRSAKKIKLNN
jgi:hypothetical protein